MTNQFLGSISAAADGREEATGLEARCRPPLAGELCHQLCGPRSSLARGRVPPLPHARELLSGGDGEELSFAGAVGEQEGGGRRTGGDARQVVRAPALAQAWLRRWNRAFPWTQAKDFSNHSPHPTPPKRTIYYILLHSSKKFLSL